MCIESVVYCVSVIYLVWPPSETTPSEAHDLVELVHEEAHPVVPIILDKLLVNTFRIGASTADPAGSISLTPYSKKMHSWCSTEFP